MTSVTKRMKREDRIHQILDCTLELLGEKSIDAVRTVEIARAAGISEGALFKHFSSKHDILDQMVHRYVGSKHPLRPAEEIETVDDFRTFLDAYLSSMIRITPQRISYLRLMLQVSMTDHDLSDEKYRQVKDGFWSIMEDRIEYGKLHWGFRKEFDTQTQVRLFHFSLLMFIIEQVVFGASEIEEFDLTSVKETVIDNLFRLLREE